MKRLTILSIITASFLVQHHMLMRQRGEAEADKIVDQVW